jgi:tetratricopeptide (TPR) repeat protein
MRVMNAGQLVAGMRKRFTLLTGGPDERHETLAAAIDGSWELLKPWEKAALAQSSVFEGGFTLEAVESILDLSAYPDAPWSVDVVQSLMDKSLMKTWVPERATSIRMPEPRFGMYVSVQEYARGKLADEGAVPQGGSGARAVRATEERHGNWYRHWGDDQAAVLDQPGSAEKLRALGNELENLMAASRRAAARGDGETATTAYRVVSATSSIRGLFGAMVKLGREVLSAPLSPEERALTLIKLGYAERDSGQLQEACQSFEEARGLFHLLGNRRMEGAVHGDLAGLHCDQGREEAARGHFDAALAISREVGDRRLEGVVLANLGNLHRLQGRMEEACKRYEEALVIHREVGNRRSEGIVQSTLGYLHYEWGRGKEARDHFDAALAIHREVGNRRWEGIVLGDLGNLDCDQGRIEEARRNCEEALVIDREVGNRRTEGIVLDNLANLSRAQGRMEEARSYYEAALVILREVGDRRSEGNLLGNLGNLHHQQGRMEEARGHYETALTIHRDTGSRLTEGSVLGNLAVLHFDQGRTREAWDTLAQGEALLRTVQAGVALAKLLCARADVEQRSGNPASARTILGEVEALADQFGAGPGSELGRMLANLRTALT